MSAPTYWHGGVPGLQVGKALLPPSVTGVRATSLQLGATELSGLQPASPERVYLFTRRQGAELWAALYGTGTSLGWVYEVQPEGDSGPDTEPWFRPGESWWCSRARILAAYPLGKAGLLRVVCGVKAFNRTRGAA